MTFQPRARRRTLISMLALISSIAAAEPRIAPTIDDIEPLAVGERAPQFTVFRADGTAAVFDPALLARPALIIFYRGGWCGACNQQLRDVSTVVTAIRDLGVDILFPNGDRTEILYSSLGPETKTAIEGLDYLLLSDSDLNAAQAFGVAYVLADDVLERYRAREHWDLEGSSIDKHDALPLPSIFLVAADGNIAFRYYDPDPRVRLSADALRDAVEQALTVD
jgi:peroxiredoxin